MSTFTDYARAAGNIYQDQGQIQATKALNTGQLWGQVLSTILPSQDERARRELNKMTIAEARERSQARAAEASQRAKIQEVLTAAKSPYEAATALWHVDPDKAKALSSAAADEAASLIQQANAANWAQTRSGLSRWIGPQADSLPDAYPGDDWKRQALLEHADVKTYLSETKPKDPTVEPLEQAIGPDGKPVFVPRSKAAGMEPFRQAPTPAADTLVEVDQNGKPVYMPRSQAAGKTPYHPAPQATSGGEPLVPVMVDGKPVLMPRSKAAGMTPANSREQGRAVTSGDAGRLAELETSLDDLAVLTKEIPAGTTGVEAKAGAMLPNFVTEWTGIGATAKSKQAVIDRVKQVIGKALEDGVLRKEDEKKYEKILPTIGDVDTVVAAKLTGLSRAIAQRRATLMEALADAGYDVTRFQSRSQGSPDPLGIR